ncbi:hypothetical protein GCM10010339_91900 [Streptomyces alanosinicus]|uniref:Uncharacterized protein n=1 Tax=Streptomyces alanosinicus TaxID=68171 RepID=A0A918YVW5_9ACTN|nr:hypothetical protein GCM10010339_91900 [Streptomyces alanosinicus]
MDVHRTEGRRLVTAFMALRHRAGVGDHAGSGLPCDSRLADDSADLSAEVVTAKRGRAPGEADCPFVCG